MSRFELDGYGNMVNILRKMPEDGYRKPVVAAFKTAAIPVKEAMVKHLPSNLKKLKKVIMIKPGKGKSMTLAVGAYGRQAIYVNSRGVKWDPYMILYWHNYGTLANRDPNHSFKKEISRASAGKRGGIRAGLFFENAVAESMPKAQKRFEQAYAWEHNKFLEKEAAK